MARRKKKVRYSKIIEWCLKHPDATYDDLWDRELVKDFVNDEKEAKRSEEEG